MTSRVIYVRGGSMHTARAQEALSRLSGVVAAEFVPGRNAVKVYCGDEMSWETLTGCLADRGIQTE